MRRWARRIRRHIRRSAERRGGSCERFRQEIEGRSAGAVDGDVAGEELIDVGAADIFRIRADGGKTIEVVGSEVG